MSNGLVTGIAIARAAGAPMELLESVMALKGCGLEGDRYALGEGSFNKDNLGKRQVTLINGRFITADFPFKLTRRNLCVSGTELMWLIGREFKIGEAVFKGVKYCDPCLRPSKLAGRPDYSFKDHFQDAGGLVADVLESGLIEAGRSLLVPPSKSY